jgi:hypothetical protein
MIALQLGLVQIQSLLQNKYQDNQSRKNKTISRVDFSDQLFHQLITSSSLLKLFHQQYKNKLSWPHQFLK